MNSLQSTSILLIAGALLLTFATLFEDEVLSNAAARVNDLAAMMAGDAFSEDQNGDVPKDFPVKVFDPDELEQDLNDDSLTNNDEQDQKQVQVKEQENSDQQNKKSQDDIFQDSNQKEEKQPVVEPDIPDITNDQNKEDNQSEFTAGPALPSGQNPTNEDTPVTESDKKLPTEETVRGSEGAEVIDKRKPADDGESDDLVSENSDNQNVIDEETAEAVGGEVIPDLQNTGTPPGFIEVPGVGIVDSETFLEALALATAAQAANGQNQNGQNQNGRNQNSRNNGNSSDSEQSSDFLKPILIDPSESIKAERKRPQAGDIIEAITAPQADKRVKSVVDVIEGEASRKTVTYTDGSFEEVEVVRPENGTGKRIQRVGQIAKEWIDSDQNQHTRRKFQEQIQELARADFDSQKFELIAMTVAPSTRMDELFETSNGFRGGRVAATTRPATRPDDDEDAEPALTSPTNDSTYWTRINDGNRSVTERGPGFGKSPDRLVFRDFIARVMSKSNSLTANDNQLAKSNRKRNSNTRSNSKDKKDDRYLLESSAFDNLGGFFSKE